MNNQFPTSRLYNQLNPSQQFQPYQRNEQTEQIEQIKGWIKQIKSMQNPQLGFEALINQNPQLRQITDFVNSMGTSPQQAFIQLAKMKGINPEQIINMLK